MGGQRDVGDAPPISAYGFASSLTNFEGLGERVLPVFEPRPDGTPLQHEPTEMSARLGGGPIHRMERHKVTEFFVDRAIAEMKRAAEGNRPFYINLWLDDVHSPMQAPPSLRGDGSPRLQYAGVMREMDRQLDRVFDHIRSHSRLRDNTLVLLASDNGPEEGLGSTGELRGAKGNLYEGGIRSPLIVWSAGALTPAARGSTNDRSVIAGMDIPPSLLSIARVAAPSAAFDGVDMSDAFTGRSQPLREKPLMWVRPPDRPGPGGIWPDLAIRDGDFKLLVMRDGSRPGLFNIRQDPRERVNLAMFEPELVKKLTAEVLAWEHSIQGHR
jgi:uncharacterized sulfatase